MMNKYLVLLFFLCFSFDAFSDCTSADLSFVGFTPGRVDFTAATTIPVDYQISHAPFTGTERCYYFTYMGYGVSSSDWSTRYLVHQTTGALIPFNVHSRASTTNGNRIRRPEDATANRHVVYRNPRFFNVSASTVTNTNTFYARLGSLPAVLEAGDYSASLVFGVAARLTNPPAGDWPAFPVPLRRSIQFLYRVEKELSLSIVATGGIFDPLSTAKLMSFGELESFEVRTADVIVKTNVGYRLTISSVNDGVLVHSSGSSIPYAVRASGSPVSLIGSSTSPVLVSSSAANSPSIGFLIPLEVEVGNVTGNEPGGEYSDILSLTIEAF